MGFSIAERWSPTYALKSAVDDMQESGLDGLKKHLTSNALKSIEKYESISTTPGVALFSTAIVGGDAISFLLGKLSECEWTLKDVMKGSETSTAILGFDYEDKIVGTVEVTLIKEGKKWKIDGLSTPKFTKLSLPQ